MSINKAAWVIAEAYKDIIGDCDKCGNGVLLNDTDEDIPVVACPICGKRFYVPNSMIKGLGSAYGISRLN